MDKKKLLEELYKLPPDQIAEIIAFLVPKCMLDTKNGKDYFYKDDYFFRYFPFWEKVGFHITLNHYYSPIPEINKLSKELWENIPQTPEIEFNAKAQLALLKDFQKKYHSEYDQIPLDKTAEPFQYYLRNGLLEGLDGYILYCMIRQLKPKRIIEIGSGYSSLLTAQACLKNGGNTEFIAIEPNPKDFIKKGFPGLSKFIHKKVQHVDLKIFDKLKQGDILFIDSSHVLKTDGDVKFEYAKILPRLKKGVIIQIHDIFLPAEYPKRFIFKGLHYNEQYLLQALLANSDAFEIIWAGHYMYLNHIEAIQKAFPLYEEKIKWDEPSSVWIRKK